MTLLQHNELNVPCSMASWVQSVLLMSFQHIIMVSTLDCIVPEGLVHQGRLVQTKAWQMFCCCTVTKSCKSVQEQRMPEFNVKCISTSCIQKLNRKKIDADWQNTSYASKQRSWHKIITVVQNLVYLILLLVSVPVPNIAKFTYLIDKELQKLQAAVWHTQQLQYSALSSLKPACFRNWIFNSWSWQTDESRLFVRSTYIRSWNF